MNAPQKFTCAGCISARMEVIRLERELEDLKNQLREALGTDPMTRLVSKSQMYKDIEYHLAKLHRDKVVQQEDHFSVIFVDIDKFKKFNDLDHLLGDRLIMEFADFLRATTRAVDILGRFGGDEFFILAPETTHKEAKQLCEKIQTGLTHHRFGTNNDAILLSASVGIASTDEGFLEVGTLVGTADKRMAEEKCNKKGCS